MLSPLFYSRLKTVLLTLVVVTVVGGLLWFWGPSLWNLFSNPQHLRSWVELWGPGAPLAYIGLQVLQVVIFALPGEVVQIAGGWLFGFWAGSLWSILGIALGSTAAFGLARFLGTSFVRRIAGHHALVRFEGMMAAPQFVGTLFFLFLIPGIPKDILCYVAGLSRVRYLAFLSLSSIARVPGILGSSLMGKALYQGEWLLLAVASAVILLLFGIGWCLREPVFQWISRFAVVPPEPEDVNE